PDFDEPVKDDFLDLADVLDGQQLALAGEVNILDRLLRLVDDDGTRLLAVEGPNLYGRPVGLAIESGNGIAEGADVQPGGRDAFKLERLADLFESAEVDHAQFRRHLGLAGNDGDREGAGGGGIDDRPGLAEGNRFVG